MELLGTIQQDSGKPNDLIVYISTTQRVDRYIFDESSRSALASCFAVAQPLYCVVNTAKGVAFIYGKDKQVFCAGKKDCFNKEDAAALKDIVERLF